MTHTWRDLLERWKLSGLRLRAGFLQADFKPADADRQAAWELYVEMLTRITTQPLPDGEGDEHTALQSVFSLFPTTRSILRRNGSDCIEFTKLAVIVLNQIVRPFTAHWHGRVSRDPDVFSDPTACAEFRAQLADLQVQLRHVQGALADIAMVEDLTGFEQPD